MIVTIRKELLEIPHALQQMFEEGRPLYDSVVRRFSWSERPVFIVGNGPAYLAALSGARAFESLLDLPAVVRRPVVFSAYTASTLTARSLLIAVSGPGECEETLQAAKKAKDRGTLVWAVTANPASELARLADAVVNYYPGTSSAEGIQSIFCQHAVMLFLAVAAARALKAPAPLLNTQEEELGQMSKHVQWVLDQISDAGSALAKELGPLPNLYVVGGGPFHPVALQAACHLRQLAGARARGFELTHFQQVFRQISEPGSGILFLSSSRCKLKGQVHQSVRESRQRGNQKIFAITDGNDRQLSERADLAVLLPVLTEAGGALLTLAFLDLVTSCAALAATRGPVGHRQEGKP